MYKTYKTTIRSELEMEKRKAIGVALVIIGLIIVLHHYIFSRRIADINDMLHHEFFEAVFLTAGLTLLISTYAKQRSGTE
jgi:uncharacterized membrane protein YvbJ